MDGHGSVVATYGQDERMPFTPSRITAILLAVRSAFAPAALLIGRMIPDFPCSVVHDIPREPTYPTPGMPVAAFLAALAFLGWCLTPQTERSTATTLPSSSA